MQTTVKMGFKERASKGLSPTGLCDFIWQFYAERRGRDERNRLVPAADEQEDDDNYKYPDKTAVE